MTGEADTHRSLETQSTTNWEMMKSGGRRNERKMFNRALMGLYRKKIGGRIKIF